MLFMYEMVLWLDLLIQLVIGIDYYICLCMLWLTLILWLFYLIKTMGESRMMIKIYIKDGKNRV